MVPNIFKYIKIFNFLEKNLTKQWEYLHFKKSVLLRNQVFNLWTFQFWKMLFVWICIFIIVLCNKAFLIHKTNRFVNSANSHNLNFRSQILKQTVLLVSPHLSLCWSDVFHGNHMLGLFSFTLSHSSVYFRGTPRRIATRNWVKDGLTMTPFQLSDKNK